MATFINKKEQVIEIELTSYGKHLISRGKFKPKYYCFYDSDIIYDGVYAGRQESQNDIIDRINTTPRLSVQTRFTSSQSNEEIGNDGENLQLNFDYIKPSSNTFFKPLGTSDRLKDKAPAWLMRNLTGSAAFSGSATYNQAMSIPVVTSSIETKYFKSSFSVPSPSGEGEIEYEMFDFLKDEYLLLDVQELNTVFKTAGNYEIEVFVEVPNDDKLKKLFFISEEGQYAGELKGQTSPENMLQYLNGTDEEISEAFPTLDNTYSEYFLKIEVDGEIEGVTERRKVGYYDTVSSGDPREPCED